MLLLLTDKSRLLPKRKPLRLHFKSFYFGSGYRMTGILGKRYYICTGILHRCFQEEYHARERVSARKEAWESRLNLSVGDVLSCKYTADSRNVKCRWRFRSEGLTTAFHKFSRVSKIGVFRPRSLTSHLPYPPSCPRGNSHEKRVPRPRGSKELHKRENKKTQNQQQWQTWKQIQKIER